MQPELERCIAELKHSRQDLQEFARAVSHELKTPLWVIGFCFDLLKGHRDKLDAETLSFVDAATDSVSKLGRMIDDLLQYSRVISRGGPLKPVDLSAALQQALVILYEPIRESGAVITHDELPVVTADRTQLVQLFQHLIDNAVKFRRGAPPQIHVSAGRQGDEWLFSVRDSGQGVDPHDADRLFTIFERAHADGEYPGTGVGLAICRRIVERHAGRIGLDSQPGQGTTVWFTLPVVPDTVSQEDAGNAAEGEAAPPTS